MISVSILAFSSLFAQAEQPQPQHKVIITREHVISDSKGDAQQEISVEINAHELHEMQGENHGKNEVKVMGRVKMITIDENGNKTVEEYDLNDMPHNLDVDVHHMGVDALNDLPPHVLEMIEGQLGGLHIEIDGIRSMKECEIDSDCESGCESDREYDGRDELHSHDDRDHDHSDYKRDEERNWRSGNEHSSGNWGRQNDRGGMWIMDMDDMGTPHMMDMDNMRNMPNMRNFGGSHHMNQGRNDRNDRNNGAEEMHHRLDEVTEEAHHRLDEVAEEAHHRLDDVTGEMHHRLDELESRLDNIEAMLQELLERR
ncbi:MAG TPA: hypothetical protein EYN86_01880 [Planctomycetes bacterium]|jgi:tetrahydromethanopterin S-methyltransferase subunit G|nr:hypothetical protein [Planctomycetota bacterium]